MKVSLGWLRDYAPLDAPVENLVHGLVETGTEVAAVGRVAAGAIVVRVVWLEPVPESTRGVRFADVDTGEPSPLRVLTGAANIRTGDLVAYAPPGTRLPGMDEVLGVRRMFGRYDSPGMLCSAAELGVGDDAEGLLVLETGRPGQPLHEVLELDTVLELEVTTNRPDCLSHAGIAREMAAAIGETAHEPDTSIKPALLSAASMSARAAVTVEDPVGCPRFAVRVIENVTVAASPPWLQRRLRAIGQRPINNVVDVTNYVAHEIGQPLHAFDLERFVAASNQDRGDGVLADVRIRRGRGEIVSCLDGVARSLGPEDLTVCAAEVPVSIAGVIGGAGTAVDDTTRTVLLEAAAWDGPTIRATSRRLGVRTEASTLYEKGLSDTLPPLALDRAAGMIAELSGGHVLRDSIDVRARVLPPIPPITAALPVLDRVLGYQVDATEAATALARLGFGVEQEGDRLVVRPPHFRRDVVIVEDVAEEVGRMLGYDRVPSTLPGRRAPGSGAAPPAPITDTVTDVCIGAGYSEAVTWSFTGPALAAAVPGLGAQRAPMRLHNPLSEEWSVLRTSLLPGLASAVALNVHRGTERPRLFEVGHAFWEGERSGPVPGSTADDADRGLPPLPAEPLLVGFAAHADDTGGSAAALRHLVAVVARLAEEIGSGPLEVVPAGIPGLRRGRCGVIRRGSRDVGLVGELDAASLEMLELRGRLALCEITLDGLLADGRRARHYRAPSRHPGVVQDLAVSVPAGAGAGEALRVARRVGGDLLEEIRLYDEYRGAGLGEGRKGWTFRLTFRATDRTLTGEEARVVQEEVARALAEACGAEVRR